MRQILIIISALLALQSQAQFTGTDSLRNYNNRHITNNPATAFTNLRLNTLLRGMIDWIDTARAGTGGGGAVGVDTLWALNDSTIRYRKNGVFRNMILKGVYDTRRKVDTLYKIDDTTIGFTINHEIMSITIPGRGTFVDSIYRKEGQDSIFYRIAGAEHAIKDSTGTVTVLNNIGTGFRWVATPSGDIKTVENTATIEWDSTTNSLSASVPDNAITNAKLAQAPAFSVKGNAFNSTDNVGDILALNDHSVLRRNGTTINFGAINLASPQAVTGILGYDNLDTSSVNSLVTQSDLKDTASALRDAIDTLVVDNAGVGENTIFARNDTLFGKRINVTGDATITTETDSTITIDVSGGGDPGGSDTQVQYNDGGVFGGDAGMTYNETTNKLTVDSIRVNDLYSDTVRVKGKVLIGDSLYNNTSYPFQIAHATTPWLSIYSLGSGINPMIDFQSTHSSIANTNDLLGRIYYTTSAGGGAFVVAPANASGTITERMRIDEAGDVSIGTTSTLRKLTVESNSVIQLRIGYSSSFYSELQTTSTGHLILQNQPGIVRLGNVGVTDFNRLQFGGTTSSFPSLHRSGTNLRVLLADSSARSDIEVAGETYGSGWDGSFEVPTKNDVYDKMETVDNNFAEDDLTFTGNRTHNANGNSLQIHSLNSLSTYVNSGGNAIVSVEGQSLAPFFAPRFGTLSIAGDVGADMGEFHTALGHAYYKADGSADSINQRAGFDNIEGSRVEYENSFTGKLSYARLFKGFAKLYGSDSVAVGKLPIVANADSIIVSKAFNESTQTNTLAKMPTSVFAKVLRGTTTWDPSSISGNSSTTTTVSVTGAALGDPVTISKASGSYSNGEIYFAYVSAPNTVTIQLQNGSGGSFDITEATYNVIVLKY